MTQAPEEVVSPGLLPGPDTFRPFNGDEPAEAVVQRLIGNADVVMEVDCADRRVNFSVRGWFVIPDKAAWKMVADRGA